MGHYHLLINLDKRQVIHPHQIGNGLKLHEQIGWRYSTGTVLVLLLAASCKGGGRGGGDFESHHPLIGSWAGDRIAFVGDYAVPGDILGFDAPLIYDQCHFASNPAATGRKPKGWREWTNISAQVREMMTAEFNLCYRGDGWLDIVDEERQQAAPSLCPDPVIPNLPQSHPHLN